MRTALAILLAVSMVLGGTITDGWLPSYAEDALSALGIRNRNEVSGQLLTAEGNDYTIHLDYKEDILPEHATLTAEELLPETEIYGKLAAPDPETEPFRLFKITVTADGADLEPAEQATATVTWKNTPATSLAGRESVSLYDAHAAEESTNPEATDAAAIITDNGDGNTAITFSMKAPAIVKLPAAPAPTATAQDTEAAENQNTPAATTGTGETEAVTEQTAGAEIAALTGGDALLNTNGENAVPSLLSMEGTRNAPLLAASKSTEYTVEVGKKISIEGKTSDKSHSWSSENKDIAKVTGSGNVCEVTGVSAGTVVITHTYKKDKTETFTIVVEPSASKVSLLTVTPSELTVTEGATETIDVTTDGCTVSSAVSSDESIATATLSENVITINGIQTGSTTITMTGEPLTGYSAPESKTITVTVVSGEERGSYTDEESTAQPSQTSDLKVSVKATGNWKKLSDYHVVVKNADQDYGGETGFLKAYHIYLADENGAVVSSEELKNGGKNLNLQVTLTYENLPDWFASASQAGNIKHYKNKDDRTSLEITNIKFDATAKTIAFKVKRFSDFVVLGSTGQGSVQNQQETQIGDSNATVTLHKTASPVDGTRDEFDITLAVDTQEKATTTVFQQLISQYLGQAKFLRGSSNPYKISSATTGVILTTTDSTYTSTYEGVTYSHLPEENLQLLTQDTGNKKLTFQFKNSSEEVIATYPLTTKENNGHVYLMLDETHYLPVGSGIGQGSTIPIKMSDTDLDLLMEKVYETVTIKDQSSIKLVTVEDKMGDCVNYVRDVGVDKGIISISGKTLTWNISNNPNAVVQTKTVKNGNTTTTTITTTGAAVLTYRIKVDTTASGFSYNNWLSANAEATLNYKVNDAGKTATFPVPKVKVIPYEYYAKLIYDANGGEKPPTEESRGPIQSVKSDGENVNFTVSSGTPTRDGYTFKGWAESAESTSGSASAGGTYTFKATSVNSANPTTRTLYAVWEQDIIPVTGLSLSGTASMVGTGAAAAGLLIALWVIRRRIWKKMS